MARVVVGLSGGVDSSVAALLLKQQGHEVIGVFMKNWDEKDEFGNCTSDADFEDVRMVCERMDIPYYTVNFTTEYYERVFQDFLLEYQKGRTPNPDVMCNTQIKFRAFLDYAQKSGADYIATGHFVRTRTQNGETALLKGMDGSKDQSYFLHGLTQEQLQNALFPVGDMTKAQVRAIAQENGFINAAKKDSTGICFIGERNFREFLKSYIGTKPGDIVDCKTGAVLGRHEGLAFYTIGQRKGMGIGGKGNGQPWFVAQKDVEHNRLLVVQGDDPVLYSNALLCGAIHWVAGAPPADGLALTVKCRYRQPDQKAHIAGTVDGMTKVVFEVPQRAVTPGQYIVFYNGDVCLGGAVIEKAIGVE